MTTDVKNELTIVRLLDAPRAKVWRACTQAEALRHWWGMPTGATMPTCKLDFRIGGTLLCEIAQPGNPPIWFKWIYREITPDQRLVLQQHASEADGRERDTPDRPVSIVVLTLEDANGQTKLTVTHKGMASAKYRVEQFEAGWSQSLERLQDHLATGH
ncbi:MAG: SRPBCC domain-containing protein [Alphaproteobacteria bacterium]|nr:SRPBCC domain-containing protein [Alphaproteobacteria bacterium]MBL7099915.1 SRPBCC domain-containing protein [Alphaproteobacteria bacterium]